MRSRRSVSDHGFEAASAPASAPLHEPSAGRDAEPRSVSRRRGRIVAFSGVDGAGKSTQIERLLDRFAGLGIRSRYVWSRGGYTPGMERLKGLLRRAPRSAMPAPGDASARSHAFKNGAIRRAWLGLAIVELLWLYGVRIRIWRRLGLWVVCDRYLLDTRVDFRLRFPADRVERWPLWRLLERVAATPDAMFLLLVPVEESLRRAALKHEPFPDSLEERARRLATYREAAAGAGPVVLDGREPVDSLATRIAGALGLATKDSA